MKNGKNNTHTHRGAGIEMILGLIPYKKLFLISNENNNNNNKINKKEKLTTVT